MTDEVWPLQRQAELFAKLLSDHGRRPNTDEGPFRRDQLGQTYVSVELNRKLRAGEVTQLPHPFIEPAGRRFEPSKRPIVSMTMEEVLRAGAAALDRALPVRARIVHMLEIPQGVFEVAEAESSGVWIRGLTDYFIGTDELVTRFDVAWVLP